MAGMSNHCPAVDKDAVHSCLQKCCTHDRSGTEVTFSMDNDTMDQAASASAAAASSFFPSDLVFGRPRSKSAPNIVEQQVALFLRGISDELNATYFTPLQHPANSGRRASLPIIFRQQGSFPNLFSSSSITPGDQMQTTNVSNDVSPADSPTTHQTVGSKSRFNMSSITSRIMFSSVAERESDNDDSGDEV